MFYKLGRALKKREGFTLVELMVVVVIIGILAAIAVPVYQNVVSGAEDNAINANIRILNSAVSMYSVENQVDDLSSFNQTADSHDELAPYIQSWPTGPGDTTYRVNAGVAQYSPDGSNWYTEAQ